MATNRKSGSRPGLIHCDNCGEDYSASYRRCPFCDEYDDGYEDSYEPSHERSSSSSGGGKRLAQSKRRGGGYTKTSPLKIIGILISLAVILAAIWIVASILRPWVQRGDVDTVDPNSHPTENVSPDPNASADGTQSDPTAGNEVTDPADASPVTDEGGATGFTLNKSEFAFNDDYPDPVTLKVTFTPAGTTGTITWTSSDPDAISVDENGTVSNGAKKGSATITATLSNGVTQTCKVYDQTTGAAAPSDSGNSGSTAANYTINNPDFTFYRSGETYRLKVNNYTGGVTWSSSNTGVATVSSDGTCTAVGSGKCTVTGTLDDGSKVEAIVRVVLS